MASAITNIRSAIQCLAASKHTLIGISSSEERLILRTLAEAGKGMKPAMGVSYWSVTRGVQKYRHSDPSTELGALKGERPILDPGEALMKIVWKEPEPDDKRLALRDDGCRGFVVFTDIQPAFVDPQFRRILTEAAFDLQVASQENSKIIVLLAPDLKIPSDLTERVALLDWPLPDRETLEGALRAIINGRKQMPDEERAGLLNDAEFIDACASAALGLTYEEAKNAYSKTFVELGRWQPQAIAREKKRVVERSGLVGYEEPGTSMDAIGGLDNLKSWLVERRGAFTAEAREWGLPRPHGVLTIGVPGCGKSMSARATAAAWGQPLLRARTPLSKYVGESQERARQMWKVIKTIAPCVFWIDELEKFVAGGTGGGENDGGTARQVFGIMLEEMQDIRDKEIPVFIFATANEVAGLPPELMRRFDERFFVDLPSYKDRMEIIGAVMRKYRCPVQIKPASIGLIAKQCAGFTGAEIEEAFRAASYMAFSDGKRPIKAQDWCVALRNTKPISTALRERIQVMRTWANGRCVLASPLEAAQDVDENENVQLEEIER